uniref:Uncharacterized protein n=1 Tax=Crocodylus porosus TaxID=8502 RepID=A0A7M4FGY1_CROPO
IQPEHLCGWLFPQSCCPSFRNLDRASCQVSRGWEVLQERGGDHGGGPVQPLFVSSTPCSFPQLPAHAPRPPTLTGSSSSLRSWR